VQSLATSHSVTCVVAVQVVEIVEGQELAAMHVAEIDVMPQLGNDPVPSGT